MPPRLYSSICKVYDETLHSYYFEYALKCSPVLFYLSSSSFISFTLLFFVSSRDTFDYSGFRKHYGLMDFWDLIKWSQIEACRGTSQTGCQNKCFPSDSSSSENRVLHRRPTHAVYKYVKLQDGNVFNAFLGSLYVNFYVAFIWSIIIHFIK